MQFVESTAESNNGRAATRGMDVGKGVPDDHRVIVGTMG
jgi:hypothetical protein